MFSDVQMEPSVFQFLPITSGPVAGYHYKEPCSTLFGPSLWVLTYTDMIIESKIMEY